MTTYYADGNVTSTADTRNYTTQLLQNPGFEGVNANGPWILHDFNGTYLSTISNVAYTGSHSLQIGSRGAAYQIVTLPASFSKLTLSYRILASGGTCTYMTVQIYSPDGSTLYATVPYPCPSGAQSAWLQVTADLTSALSAHSGQQVAVRFENSDASYVDDVALNATQLNGTTTSTYNAVNQLTQQTVSSGLTTSYTYDAVGNMLTKSNSTGTWTYTYTVNDQTATEADPWGQQTTFGYDQDGNQTQINSPNGVTQTTTYDSGGQVTQVQAKNSGNVVLTSSSYSYTNPSTQNTTTLPYSETDSSTYNGTTSTSTTTNQYNSGNELTQASQTGSSTNTWLYGYDAVGNLTSKTVNGLQTTMTYNAANELTVAGSTAYSYDGNGNRTGDTAGNSFGYNAASQTTTVAPAGATTEAISYTAGSQGQQAVVGASQYQYDVTGVSSIYANHTTTNYTTSNLGALLGERVSNASYYYLYDGRGSVVGLTGSAGTLANQYSYDPTGNTTTANLSVTNLFQYAGMQYDSSTGLYNDGSNSYDPSTVTVTQQNTYELIDPALGNRCDKPQVHDFYARLTYPSTGPFDAMGWYSYIICGFFVEGYVTVPSVERSNKGKRGWKYVETLTNDACGGRDEYGLIDCPEGWGGVYGPIPQGAWWRACVDWYIWPEGKAHSDTYSACGEPLDFTSGKGSGGT